MFAAAVLVGVGLDLTRLAKQALEISPAAFKLTADRAQRVSSIRGIASVVSLLTGVGLIFMRGGFARVTTNYHIAMGLLIVGIVVGILVAKPATDALSAAHSDSRADAPAARAAIKKLAMGQGISHLLWLPILFLMLYRF